MAESVLLEAQKRDAFGSHAAHRLRRGGRVPAVLYGHKEATLALTLPAESLATAIRHGVRVLDLKADGKVEKALIREVQWDHLGQELLHVDFARISKDERIVVTVPLAVRGQSPGVAAGGLLDQPLHILEIECLALSMPDSIRVNVNELQIGQAIHVSDLKLPEGVKAVTDADAIVVQVKAPLAEPETGAAPAGEQAEPEVIGRQKAAEGEGEEK